MGSTKVSAPPPRDYAKESKETLENQIKLAPQLAESEAIYRPFYADLERGIMLEQLGIDPSLGLLEAYEDYIAPSQVRQKRATVEGDIAMVRDLGSELVQAQREADPLAEDLRQTVLTGAGDMAEQMGDELDGEFIQGLREEYEAGGGLTEQEQRDLDQQVLGMAQREGQLDKILPTLIA